jgi:hypothetical protein
MEVLGNGKIKLLLKLTERIQDSKNFQKTPKPQTQPLIKTNTAPKKAVFVIFKKNWLIIRKS